MSAPVSNIPNWATDPVFTASAEIGQTPRIEPSEANKGQGIRPGTFPARWANWLFGAAGDWIGHLAKAHPRSWRKEASGLPWTGATYSTVLGNPASTGQGGWLIPGYTDGGSYLATAILWPAPQDATGEVSQTARSSVAGTTGLDTPAFTSVGICGNGTVIYGVSAAVTSTQTCVYRGGVTDAGSLTKVLLIGETYIPTKVAASGSVVVVVPASNDGWIDGAHFWVSTDSGASFYQRTISGSPGAKTVASVVVDSSGVAAVAMWDEDSIMFLTDAGVTITPTSTPAASGFVGITRTRLGWYALSRSERYLVRWTGSAWVQVSTLAYGPPNPGASPTSGRLVEGNLLASDGERVFVVPIEISGVGLGVAWSIDRGVTWTYDIISQTRSTVMRAKPVAVAYGGGEFILLARMPGLDGTSPVFEIWRSSRV